MSDYYQINVSLEVFKSLTARLEFAGQSHDDVLRELLNVDSEVSSEPPEGPFGGMADALSGSFVKPGDFFSRGLILPNGTVMRARYKQIEHSAIIKDGRWLDQFSQPFSSPSAAAKAITGTNVNGLRFWYAKRPDDSTWRRLELLLRRPA